MELAMAYKTILVLCDSSDAAAAWLAFACRLACANGANLGALYIAPIFMASTPLDASFGMASHFR